MSAPYEIVRYRPGHERQVAGFASQLWGGGTPLALRYLAWKHVHNPYAEEPAIYLAFAGSELVGMRGFYGSRWEAGLGSSRVVRSLPVADDLVVASAHRNRGVVTLIMRAALEDLARRGHRHALNLTGGQVTVMGSLAMGWRSAGPLAPIGLRSAGADRQARGVLAGTRMLWRLARGPWPLPGGMPRPFRRLDAWAGQAGRGPIALGREPRIDAMSELVRRLGHDGRIRHVRDREFFAWRFRDPRSSYRFLYHDGASLEGFLVLQTPAPARRSEGAVRVVDLEGSSAAVRARLLGTALDAGQFAEVLTWAAAIPQDAHEQLSARGFQPVDLEARAHGCPCVLVKSLAPEADGPDWELGGRRLTDLADWDLRMIDTMAG